MTITPQNSGLLLAYRRFLSPVRRFFTSPANQMHTARGRHLSPIGAVYEAWVLPFTHPIFIERKGMVGHH